MNYNFYDVYKSNFTPSSKQKQVKIILKLTATTHRTARDNPINTKLLCI